MMNRRKYILEKFNNNKNLNESNKMLKFEVGIPFICTAYGYVYAKNEKEAKNKVARAFYVDSYVNGSMEPELDDEDMWLEYSSFDSVMKDEITLDEVMMTEEDDYYEDDEDDDL